jgi:hypothetical protein
MKGEFVTRHSKGLTSSMVTENTKEVEPRATVQALAIG